jgi:hypothetical protein
MMRVVLAAVVGALVASAQQAPSNLTELVAKARLSGTVAAWCRAEFRFGRPGAFAVAVTSAEGGRYMALDVDGAVTELGRFKGAADLSCYSRSAAEAIDATIGQSETIHGHVTPRWDTTVVCGFTDDTAAECWQYSPVDRSFAQVGGWVT